MKYMGSKNRLSKDILPILNSFNDRQLYIEPFVGGANIIDKVDFKIKRGLDKNPYLIALLNYLTTDGELPLSISEEEYYIVRDNKDKYDDWYVGLVGFCASYGGRFFEGYPRGKNNNGISRDYTNEAIRNIEKQRKNLKDIKFKTMDYLNLDLSKHKCLIYCDPPYRNSKPYKVSLLGNFNSDVFWEWVRNQSISNPVIVSEYEAPDDFITMWEKDGIKSNLKNNGTKTSTEKLFIYNKWVK
jgi:DNA adenine methylase